MSYSQIEGVKVIYGTATTKSIKTENKDVKSYLEKSNKQFNNISFELLANKDGSFFKLEDKVIKENEYPFYRMAVALTGGLDKQWYFNGKTGIILKQYVFMGDLFLVESNIENIEWSLTGESKLISNFKTYKATCYRTLRGSKGLKEKLYEVWYSPELPFPTGPMGLAGLPGLILEMSSGRVKVYAEKIERVNVANIKPPKNGQKMLEADFNNFASKKMSDFRNKN